MFLPLLFKHPLTKQNITGALARYLKWHFLKLINKDRFVYTLVGNTRIHLSKKDSAALVNYYSGFYEFEEMCFLLHFLREDDLMIDVGANIGVFSLLASGHIGCHSLAFEPIPNTFQSLKNNIELNTLKHKVTFLNIGVGASAGVLKFTNNLESSVNRVASKSDKDIVEVEIKRLDDVIGSTRAYEAILLKVDVEGFETEVLKGAHSLLQNTKLKSIIIELNGSGEKYGFDESAINMKLIDYGFKLLYYHPFTRTLSENNTYYSWGNAIFIRDTEFVTSRLCSGRQIKILDKVI